MPTVPSSVYRKYAEGSVTEEEVRELEKWASALSDPDLKRTLAVIAATTVMTPALTALGAGAVNKTMSAMDKLTMRRDLRRILEIHPSLGDMNDPHVMMAYQTLRALNPDYAKDPLIAGPLLQQMLHSRMIPGDPRSAPRMDPGVAAQLVSSAAARKKGGGNALAELSGKSLATGGTEAIRAIAAHKTPKEQKS
jgi:hypothetical protein